MKKTNHQSKPKRSSTYLVNQMRQDMGIRFEEVGEKEAITYMQETNNFLRVASYRKNFPKDQGGRYLGLDFACLMELADLDRELRRVLLNLCLDMEHYLKVKLVTDIERDKTTDGYDIVNEFLSKNRSALSQMELNASGEFTQDLIEKYFTVSGNRHQTSRPILAYDDCPAWVLVEVLNLNHLIRFYCFYYESRGRAHLSEELLGLVRTLRNACAHNNCLLANMKSEDRLIPEEIEDWLAEENASLLTSRPMLEYACLLYAYKRVTPKSSQKEALKNLEQVLQVRCKRHAAWFKDQERLLENYQMAKRILALVRMEEVEG